MTRREQGNNCTEGQVRGRAKTGASMLRIIWPRRGCPLGEWSSSCNPRPLLIQQRDVYRGTRWRKRAEIRVDVGQILIGDDFRGVWRHLAARLADVTEDRRERTSRRRRSEERR